MLTENTWLYSRCGRINRYPQLIKKSGQLGMLNVISIIYDYNQIFFQIYIKVSLFKQ